MTKSQMGKNLVVSLKSFGPFDKAKVELRPLTIFIGRNSTGKSMLLYLLWTLVAATPSEGEIRQRWGILYEKAESISKAEEEIRDFLRVSREVFKSAIETGLETRLRQTFGVEPRELVKEGETNAQIGVKGTCGDLNILLTDSVSLDKLDICGEDEFLSAIVSTKRQLTPHDYIIATMRFLAEKVADEYSILLGSATAFLPHNRTCALAEDREFAYNHLIDEYRQSGHLTESAKQLLRDIGVELDVSEEGLVVKTRSGKILKLTHASSGIREVAAVVLALSSETIRYVFIEEPEIGLHPAAQRLMARAVVEAVNSGKYVALTTHSDYLIAEINNLIAAKTVRPEAVAAYLTKAVGNSAAAERLDVDDAGIPEDEFAEVAEEILETRNELY